MKKVIILLSLLSATAFAVNNKAPLVKYVAMVGDELITPSSFQPSEPGLITQSPGDTVGWTFYDFQSNGSIGNRIVLDNMGTVHVTWINSPNYPSQRSVHFNCKNESGWLFPGSGSQVGYRNNDGYPNIAATADGRAAIAYHNAATAGAESLYMALDAFNCLGQFNYFHPPDRFSALYGIWPAIAVQSNGNIHISMTTRTGSIVGYTRSIDGGDTWTPAVAADTSGSISQVITASPVSDKVAIIYTRTNPDSQVATVSDIYYIQSADGLVWDWSNARVNATNYGPDADSLSAGSDLDAIYDYNDNLHIIWNAHWVSGGFYYYLSWLYHYDSASGIITEIAESDSLWPSAGCDYGGWNWHYCKMSLGTSAGGGLFLTYTDFDTVDCSAGGYANGDIYGQYSGDGGATWNTRVNLTNSQTPGCLPGDCDSDNWSSIAEKVDDYVHLFYVNDKDAGGIPQTEGSVTENPMLYYRIPVGVLGVEEDQPLPSDFTLSQNYPNPFNARTTINFSLQNKESIRLEVFDILGAKIATLFNGTKEAGSYAITWDGAGMASGIYYYRLSSASGSITKQMVLVK